jgi:hypothetical protein
MIQIKALDVFNDSVLTTRLLQSHVRWEANHQWRVDRYMERYDLGLTEDCLFSNYFI